MSTAEPVVATEPAPAPETTVPAPEPAQATEAAPTSTKKEIIVLGASFAGFGTAHSILRHVLPSLPNKGADYHVTLIDRDSTWFNRVPSPRVLTTEKLLSIDKVMLKEPQTASNGFKEYKGISAEQYSFVQGLATKLDGANQTLTIEKPDGSSEAIKYHALIIATGAASPSPVLGVQPLGGSEVSAKAIEAFRAKLPEAKSIVIAGGGPAGVETAGEIGHFLNGSAGWFGKEPKAKKAKITLVTNAKQLLPILRPALAKKAEVLLKKVGVDVVYETSVVSTLPERAGRVDVSGKDITEVTAPTKITLSNGEVLEADLYIPAYGLSPNTAWLPKEILTEKGKVAADQFLRVPNAGPNIYAVGDVANYDGKGIGGVLELMWGSVPVLITNLKRDLLKDSASDEKKETGRDRPFEFVNGESQVVPIGRSTGVGALFGWRIPGFFIWLIKGRDYMTGMPNSHPEGMMFKSESKWKEM
jgi:NADH dehydrogenase FAD-containing subunit